MVNLYQLVLVVVLVASQKHWQMHLQVHSISGRERLLKVTMRMIMMTGEGFLFLY